MADVLAQLSEVSDALDQAEGALRESRPPVVTPAVAQSLAAAEAALDRANSAMESDGASSDSEALAYLLRIDFIRDQASVVHWLLEKAVG